MMISYWRNIKSFGLRWETYKSELDALPVCNDKYIKTKIITYGDKVYANFCGLYVPQDGIECAFFTVISIESILVYDKKCYIQLYLDNCTNKIVDKKMLHFLHDNIFKDDED